MIVALLHNHNDHIIRDHRRGAMPADVADQDPVPAALMAATRNTYPVPLVRPVTVAEVLVLVPSLNVVQLVAAVVLNWTM